MGLSRCDLCQFELETMVCKCLLSGESITTITD
jgi:hypothetical protein